MNARYTVLAAAVAGFVAGAVTIDKLHAQAKAPVFYVSEIDMKNAEAYQKEYAPKAQAVIRKHGGKILGFQNLTGKPDQAWLGGALAETLTTELGADDRLRITSAEEVAQLRRVQGSAQDRREVRDLPRLGHPGRAAAVTGASIEKAAAQAAFSFSAMRRRRARQPFEQLGNEGLAHFDRDLRAFVVLENEQQLARLFEVVALDELF